MAAHAGVSQAHTGNRYFLPLNAESLPRDFLLSLLQKNIPQDTPLFLDEAQCLPPDQIFQPYTRRDDGTHRSILSPLVSSIQPLGFLRMVIAGTGLSLKSLPEITSPLIAGTDEKEPALVITNLDGFHTREQIASCLRTFLFMDLAADDQALQYLFDRVRGRARFLVGVLTNLAQREIHDLSTLKQVCRIFIEAMTSTEEERSLAASIDTLGQRRSLADQLPRIQVADFRQEFKSLTQLVFHFRYYSLPCPAPTGADPHLLEYALCRFAKGFKSVSIDEPLVVLAYIRCVEPIIAQTFLFDNITNSPNTSTKGCWFEFFLLLPLLRRLSSVPLNEVDRPIVLAPVPQLFLDLFQNATQTAASSSGASFPHFLSLPFTVEYFDPLDEPVCLSEVNRYDGEDGYDILEYFMRANRPPAFYPHIRAGPDCVMILRFGVYRVPLFIQFKSARPPSIKAELKSLNPVNFYSTGPKEKGVEVDILNERHTQLNDYIQKTFEGRWLGLLIMGGDVLGQRHRQLEASGMAIATTLHQFLLDAVVQQVSQVVHHKAREGPLGRSPQPKVDLAIGDD